MTTQGSLAPRELNPRIQTLLERIDPELRRWIRPGSRFTSHPLEPARWGPDVPRWKQLLGSELPRGSLVELVGRPSQGRWGLVLELLAGATREEENAALVDLGDALDPEVALSAGIRCERLLWIRPRKLAEALAAAEAVLHAGFPCVCVDLGVPPICGGRGTHAHWLRLARAAQQHRSLLVVSTPYSVSGIATGQRLELGTPRVRWSGQPQEPPLLEPLQPVRRRAARSELPLRPGASAAG